MSSDKENKKTPWGEFQGRVRELTKLNFRENLKLSSFLKNEKSMSEWTDFEILQRAIHWCMNVYEKDEAPKEETPKVKGEKEEKKEETPKVKGEKEEKKEETPKKKVEKVETPKVKGEKEEKKDKGKSLKGETPKPEIFEIDTEFKGLKSEHFVAKNKSLKGIIFRKFKDTYVSRGKVENLINPAYKDYWKNRENLSEEDIENISIFNIKCFQDVPILTSDCKDTGFFCFEDNKTISDSPLKNLVFKEKSKGFVCVGKIEGLTNPYDKDICNLLELNEEEKDALDVLCYKYDYTKYKKNLEPKTPKPKKVKVSDDISNESVSIVSEEDKNFEDIIIPVSQIEEDNSDSLYKRRKNIPKYIKTLVWNKYIGDGIAKAKCMSCRETEIRNTSFHCGHVVSFKEGGDLNINNLRAVCSHCNLSMGTRDMRSFVKEFFGWDI